MTTQLDELESFIATWPENSKQCLALFLDLKEYLAALDLTDIEFHSRPGLTYSLRGVHKSQGEKPLFVMVDVIDADPRWLSVCFYGEMVTDPEEKGDYVPGGLLGEDGMCFDVEDGTPELIAYIKQRIAEAYGNANN